MNVTPLNIIFGKPISRAWRGFGPAIFFELGTLTDNKGEYSICYDFCPWVIYENDKSVLHSESPYSEMDSYLPKVLHNSIQQIDLDEKKMKLTVHLEKCSIVSTHKSERDELYVLLPGSTIVVSKNLQILKTKK